jgi:hypothetical protein
MAFFGWCSWYRTGRGCEAPCAPSTTSFIGIWAISV